MENEEDRWAGDVSGSIGPKTRVGDITQQAVLTGGAFRLSIPQKVIEQSSIRSWVLPPPIALAEIY